MAGASTGTVARHGQPVRRRGQNTKRWVIAAVGAGLFLAGLFIALRPYLRQRQAKHDVDVLALALNGFALENKRFPQGNPAQVAALLRGENIGGQNPKKLDYIEAGMGEMNKAGEFVDPWGSPYRLSVTGGVRVYSCGPNRQDEQGNGDDIASWR